jgi:hypothetical protein
MTKRKRSRRRADMFRAHRANLPPAQTCPACRKGMWPTRTGARTKMKEVSAQSDYAAPPGYAPNVYWCPAGYGWHWGFRRTSDTEKTG